MAWVCYGVRLPLVIFLLTFLFSVPGGFGAENSPLRGFISIEPYEIRVEALVRPSAFAGVWRFEKETINAADKDYMVENVVTLLHSGVVLKNEGRALDFSESKARFITPHPERGYIEDDRAEIPLEEALIGVLISSGESMVKALEGEWIWFAPEQTELTIEVASSGKPAARMVTPESRAFNWESTDGLRVPLKIEIPEVEFTERDYLIYVFGVGTFFLVIAGLLVMLRQYETPEWNMWLAVIGVICLVASFLLDSHYVTPPDQKRAEDISYGLLRNIYHSFDFRDESTIYDTLAESVSGILLEGVYLEVLESLELGEQGGPRVRVHEIDLRECELLPVPEGAEGFIARCEWVTIGEVTHWGHTHERTNLYEAKIRYDPVELLWKITSLDLMNEERMQKVSRRQAVSES